MNTKKSPEKSGWKNFLKTFGPYISVFISIFIFAFYLGKLEERVKNTHERMDPLVEQMNALNTRIDKQKNEIEIAKDAALAEIRSLTNRSEDPGIFVNGSLTSGLDMGVNTSGGLTNWVNHQNGYICMAYPPGQSWGAVFITVGEPTQRSRPARDCSRYQKLSLELRGQNGGESIKIGLKDNTDPDDGSETKVTISNLPNHWKAYEIPLSSFNTADLKRLYTVTEFVFEKTPMTVCFREIKFLP